MEQPLPVEQAKQLLDLVEEIGLVEAIQRDLYLRWSESTPSDWAAIHQQRAVVDQALQTLKRMAS